MVVSHEHRLCSVSLPVCDSTMSTFSHRKRQTRWENAIVSGPGVAPLSRESVSENLFFSLLHQFFRIRVLRHCGNSQICHQIATEVCEVFQNQPPANVYSRRLRDHVHTYTLVLWVTLTFSQSFTTQVPAFVNRLNYCLTWKSVTGFLITTNVVMYLNHKIKVIVTWSSYFWKW